MFVAGAFVQGGVYGLRRSTAKFRQSLSATCRVFNHYMPSHTYTSVILQQSVVTSLHQDSHNEEGSSNLLVSFTPSHGPILWVENPQGETRCPDANCAISGNLLSKLATFDPASLHSTVSYGHAYERIVAVAFTSRQPERMSDQSKRVLQELGFNPPTSK